VVILGVEEEEEQEEEDAGSLWVGLKEQKVTAEEVN